MTQAKRELLAVKCMKALSLPTWDALRSLRAIHRTLPRSQERTEVSRMIAFLSWTDKAVNNLCLTKRPSASSASKPA